MTWDASELSPSFQMKKKRPGQSSFAGAFHSRPLRWVIFSEPASREASWPLLTCWSWVLLPSLVGQKILEGSHCLLSAIIKQQNLLNAHSKALNGSLRTERLARSKSHPAFAKSLIAAIWKQDDCSKERQRRGEKAFPSG